MKVLSKEKEHSSVVGCTTELPSVKECRGCGEEKDVSEFSISPKGKVRYECKVCTTKRSKRYYVRNTGKISRRMKKYMKGNLKHAIYAKEWRIKNRFRIALRNIAHTAIRRGHAPCVTIEEEVREAFTGLCHSCGVPEKECKQKLCLDHCHTTGAFRGWLCCNCNVALGNLQDSVDIILLLAEYTKRTQLTRGEVDAQR